MKKSELRQIIKEEIQRLNEDADNLVLDIERTIKKYFPKSYVKVDKSKFVGKDLINIRFNLVPKDRWLNGVFQNPPLPFGAAIWINGDQYEYEPSHTKLYITPDKPKYAYGSAKLPLRKKKGNEQQILTHIDKQFAGIYKVVKANKDNLKNDFGKEYIK